MLPAIAAAGNEPYNDGVLVADDDGVCRTVFQSCLERWRYKTTVVQNGLSAWSELQATGSPRLVLLDWMLPDIDGLELCRRIRGLRRQSYSYIIVVTGRNNKDDVVTALEAG